MPLLVMPLFDNQECSREPIKLDGLTLLLDAPVLGRGIGLAPRTKRITYRKNHSSKSICGRTLPPKETEL